MSDRTGRHTLKHPITFTRPQQGEETVTEIVLRRATAGDFRVTDRQAGEVGKAIALIARLADLPIAAVDLIDSDDFTAICDILGMGIGGDKA